jgi:AcrR family transcriptional regulator
MTDFTGKQLQILQTAEKLFSEKGYDGTSVRDIAEEANVNIAMISYYFGSKEKLMEVVFEQRTEHVKLQVASLLNNEKLTPSQKIDTLVNEYIDRIVDKEKFIKIMMCEQVINKNPVVSKLIYDMRKKNTQEITRLIKEGQQSGVFKKNIDVPLMMSTLIGTVSQTMASIDYYREHHKMIKKEVNPFDETVKKRLSNHLKLLFKVLIHEV